jgi:hypothetical protein
MEFKPEKSNTTEQDQKVPEDWRTSGDLAVAMGCPKAAMYLIIKYILSNISDKDSHLKKFTTHDRHGQPTRYYSPKICEAVRKQLEMYPFMPSSHRTEKQIAHLFNAEETRVQIPGVISFLKEKGKITGKLFTSQRDGSVVEGFPIETNKIIHEFLIELAKRKK